MPSGEEEKVKIRFKFRSGEEFEAEGSPDFIEKQRFEFLQLIGKESRRAATRINLQPGQDMTPGVLRRQTALSAFSVPDQANSKDNPLPAASVSWAESEPKTAPAHITAGLSAAETRRADTVLPSVRQTALWEQVIKTEDNLVLLRRKSRLLATDTAALVLIAAAKVLLQAADGYSALALSKSLKRSGYGGERLDRILAAEMKQGTVKASGSKRSRAYFLSDEGFARAYVLAGKLAEDIR